MTAGRLYVVQSWANASAFSGEQIGTRLAQSKGLHLNRDGTANIALYDDERWLQEKENKREKTPQQILLPHSLALDKFDKLEAQIDNQFDSGEIDQGMYSDLICALYLQKAKAFRKHMLCIGQYESWLDERAKEQSAVAVDAKPPGTPTAVKQDMQITSWQYANAELYGLLLIACILAAIAY